MINGAKVEATDEAVARRLHYLREDDGSDYQRDSETADLLTALLARAKKAEGERDEAKRQGKNYTAVMAEREACAKIAEGDLFEQHYRSWPHWNPGGNLSRERDVTKLAEATATAIRARSTKEG
jgi:hypothetical protein